MYCPYCGEKTADNSRFCASCGKKLPGFLKAESLDEENGRLKVSAAADDIPVKPAAEKRAPEKAAKADPAPEKDIRPGLPRAKTAPERDIRPGLQKEKAASPGGKLHIKPAMEKSILGKDPETNPALERDISARIPRANPAPERETSVRIPGANPAPAAGYRSANPAPVFRDSEKPSAARHSIPAAGAAAGSLPKKKGGGSWQSVIGIAIVVVIAAAIIVFRMVDYNLFSARTQLDVGLMEEFPWGTDLYDAEEILVEMGYDVENNGDVLTIHSDVNRKWEYSFHIFSMGSGVNMGTASLAKTDPDGKIYEKCLEELEYELGPGDYINESRVEFWYDDTEIALIRLDDYVQVTLIWYGAEDFGYDDMPRLY